eukprot:SAG31_NODE_5714_length_2367_cov_1.231481_3_plen_164_part_00
MAAVTQPACRELPEAFFAFMAANMDDPLVRHYRGYIRHQVKPSLKRVKEILHAHFSAMQLPQLDLFIQMFPGHSKVDSVNMAVHLLLAYDLAWDRVLAEWDTGELDVLFPACIMMPFGFLYKLLAWSRQRGEAEQQALIGMSSGKKDASTKFLDALLESASEV